MSESNKPKFAFGDHVRVAGYYPRVFKVDGYRREEYFYPDEQWTELVYELHDVVTAEWLEAEEEDLTPAGEVEVQSQGFSIFGEEAMPFMFYNFGQQPKEPRKPTARELSAQEAEKRRADRKERAEQIDNLLDMREWYRKAMERTNDEAYGDRIMAIDCELKKLADKS